MPEKEKTLTPQEQSFLTRNFNVLHARQGRTLQAAEAAMNEYRRNGEKRNPDSKYPQELAQQVVVLHHAAAYLQRSFVLAFPHLWKASQIALKAYPIAKSPDEALKKGQDWQGVFGKTPNGAFETMRTTVNLLATLRGLVNDTANPDILVKMLDARCDIDQVRSQILQILLDAMKNDSEKHRALLLTALEYLPSTPGAHSLHFERHAQARMDVYARATIFSRILKRSFESGDYHHVLNTFKNLFFLWKENPQLRPQILRDLAKTFGSNKQKRMQQWHKELRERPNTVDVIGLVQPWTEVTHISDGTNVWPLR